MGEGCRKENKFTWIRKRQLEFAWDYWTVQRCTQNYRHRQRVPLEYSAQHCTQRACTQKIYIRLAAHHQKRLQKPWPVLTNVSNNAYSQKPGWKNLIIHKELSRVLGRGLTSLVDLPHLTNLKSKTQKYQMIPMKLNYLPKQKIFIEI